jgi:hypothetical protein
MTAEAIIAQIEALPKTERSKVFAYVNEAIDADDSWIPATIKESIEQALSGQTVELDRVLSGEPPRTRK